ncbi:MAG: DUF3656 domain-containing protein [Candidatus Eisenbacteria bacterium]
MSPASKPEVLSPAGSPDALQAAIAAGCDAVYFGLTDYNARIRAKNFELGDLPDVVRDLRRWGVRSCLTFNTLVFWEEEAAAKRVLEAIALAGPDALIVQDLGVVRWVREIAPAIEVHASTQATATSPGGVNLLARLGVTRVVLARELTVPEIARLRAATEVELEVFVHGALCVSYSGQCLSSEAWGGRSANRGQCAQACRHPYDLIVDGQQRELGDRAYLLSPRDLEGYRRIPELTALGIAAFKIEGRMKSAEYVAAATSLYRTAVDRAWNARLAADAETGQAARVAPTSRQLEELAQRARQIYSRGASEGFLGGINHQRLVDGRTRSHRGLLVGRIAGVQLARGGRATLLVDTLTPAGAPEAKLRAGDGIVVAGGPHEEDERGGRIATLEPGTGPRRLHLAMQGTIDHAKIKVGDPVFRTSSPDASRELERFLGKPEATRQIPLVFAVEGRADAPLRLTVRDPEGREVEGHSEIPLAAATQSGLDEAQLHAQLSRLGGTRYRLAALECDLEPDLFLPVSELNRIRREAVHALDELRGRGRAPSIDVAADPVEEHPAERPATPSESPIGWAVAQATAHEVALRDRSTAASNDGGDFAPQVSVLCRDREQVAAAVEAGARRVVLDFLDLVGLKDANAWLRSRGITRCLALPRVQKPGEEKIESFFLGLEPEELLLRNLGSVEQLRSLRLTRDAASFPRLVGDTSLNGVNPAAIAQLLELGLDRITPGFDLNGEQLLHLVGAVDATRLELPLHHHLPVFHTEHCVFAAFLSEGADWRTCGRPCDRHRLELRDRVGAQHPVVADVGCRNTVWSARAQSAIEQLPQFRRDGVRDFRIELISEDRPATLWTLDTYRAVWDGRKDPKAALSELSAESRYGVAASSPEPPRTPAWKPVGGKRRPPRPRPCN